MGPFVCVDAFAFEATTAKQTFGNAPKRN